MLKQKYKAKVWLIKLRYLTIKKVFSFHRYFLPFLKSIIDIFFLFACRKNQCHTYGNVLSDRVG